jgi:O-antigen/teichoic acid export membrane protein
MPPGRPSLARSSFLLFSASLSTLVFGLATSIVTARWLGPEGKGTLSALLFLGEGMFLNICALGLGEAAVILFGRGQASLQDALASGLVPLFLSGCLGVGGMLIISIPAQWSAILPVVLLEGGVFVAWVFVGFFITILNAEEQFALTSLFIATRYAVIAVATWIFVAGLGLGILGGVLGSGAGALCLLALCLRRLHGDGKSLRPKLSVEFLRSALRFGIPIQAAWFTITMSQRLDQLIVYSIRGEADGGVYAVALTLGQLVTFAPMVLSATSFPRLTSATTETALSLIGKVSRVALTAALVTAVFLCATLPIAVPLLFGRAYDQAIIPAALLSVGGILWSQQWILARTAAARGNTRVLLVSFASSLVAVLVLDVLLVPAFGILGAAWASLTSNATGLIVCLMELGRIEGRRRLPLAELLPGKQDILLLVQQAATILPADWRPISRATAESETDPE